MNLPDQFKRKMQRLLGEEFAAFEASYDKPRRRGLRVNQSKISPEEFERIAPFPLERIPWVENGYYYGEDVRPARHPYYAAGLYYLQEPSAMTPASRLPLRAGDRVLDLCAAPGGKATELAARLAVLDRQRTAPENAGQETPARGVLIANDISQPRAKALLHNLEMTGTDNYCVLNETPERLANTFPAFFDKILVDAPCSGEGMFRKEEEALRLWCPERVGDFARQQKGILDAAYPMLRPGGILLYSTCTFSPEENEQQIAAFLKKHPDMELQEIPSYEGFAPGRSDWVQEEETDCKDTGQQGPDDPMNIRRCIRIWPHRMGGEGHFLALMRKNACGQDIVPDPAFFEAGKKQKAGRKKTKDVFRPDREQIRLLRSFLCDIVGDAAAAEQLCGRTEARQNKAFLPVLPAETLSGLHVMRGGVYLGDWKKNRFEPSQAWAMTLAEGQNPNGPRIMVQDLHALSLPSGDPCLARYLAGESFPAEDCKDGWALILADQYPVGWAKVVHGTAKNHYPASWRVPGSG